MAVDSGVLYLSDNNGDIASLLPSGGAPVPIAGAGGLTYLTIQSHVLYYVGSSGVYSLKTSGGTPMLLGGGGTAVPSAIAVDANAVYWIGSVPSGSPLGNAIQKVALTGSAVTTIAITGQTNGSITGLTIDESSAYWVDTNDVMKGALTGGKSTKLASAAFSVAGHVSVAMAVDGGYLYFTTTSALCKIPVTGGTVTTLATDLVANVLAIDATSLYYWGGNGLTRLTPR